MARSLEPVEPIPAVPAYLLEDCRFCNSCEAVLPLLPQRGIVDELGTDRGDFARSIMRLDRPSALHLIDIDYSQFNSEGLGGPAITRHVGYTHETIAAFPDEHFDWVYIDAEHSYADCRRDAQAAAAKAKPGGLPRLQRLAHIDPWLGRYGVQRAVAEFAMTPLADGVLLLPAHGALRRIIQTAGRLSHCAISWATALASRRVKTIVRPE